MNEGRVIYPSWERLKPTQIACFYPLSIASSTGRKKDKVEEMLDKAKIDFPELLLTIQEKEEGTELL